MKTIVESDEVATLSQLNRLEECFKDQHKNESTSFSQQNTFLSTQEKLELSSWGLPEEVFQFYYKKGITKMFQWQLDCLMLGGVLDAGNLVYSAPTSAGKTLVAEILISKCIFEQQKKALVILPFVSVVKEKMFYFQEMYASSGVHVEGYMGGYSSSVNFKQVNVAVCTIEKANSIVNKVLEEQSLNNLGIVVVDELHMLGDPYRGYLLELLLTKLKYVSSKTNSKVQVVGMSATLPNLKSLADWLNADLYYTDFRPIPLFEKLKCGNEIYDKNLVKISEIIPLLTEVADDSENVGQLCLDTIKNDHSVLIFCPTKVWCENLAERISFFFKKNICSTAAETEGMPGYILRHQLDLKKIYEVLDHLKMCPAGLDKDLHKAVSYGVAFHHAGLTFEERDIIEGSFKKGSIRVLCATSTLSSGVNLPARRVIIRSPMSFGGLMDILTYRQMIGRAGRMGVDSEGESILICKPNEKAMCQTLMRSTLKPIESCLGHGCLSASLKRALLEIIASGIAVNPAEVKTYASCTFLASSSRLNIQDPIQSCVEFLEENEFIRLKENGSVYVATPLAKACLASSLPPDEGLALFKELQRARRCFVLDTDLHIIYQVTPYSVSEQWSKVGWFNVLNMLESLPANMKRVGEMVGVEESFLVRIVKGSINPNAPEYRNKLAIHRRFYTSLALQDLVNEMPLSEVAEKFQCNKGMLQSLQQSAATYAGMVTEFTKQLGWGSVELIFSEFQERLQFGIQRELCELMHLSLLNAMRARALFNSGYTNLSSIANANVSDLENIFFTMAPFQSKKEIAGETTYDKDQRNKMETVWVTGKADLSIRRAAELLVSESRSILELKLGLEKVEWGKKENTVLIQNKNFFSSSFKVDGIESKVVSESQSNLPKIKVKKGMAVNVFNEVVNENTCDKISINNSNVVVKNQSKIIDEKINKNLNSLVMSSMRNINDNVPETDSENEKVDEEKETSQKTNLSKLQSCLSLQLEDVDCFDSSFNVDSVSNLEMAGKSKSQCLKNINSKSFESDSNSSVEILYDSTIHNGSKNLSLSRISEDMFDISKTLNDSRKKMSTPKRNESIQEHELNSKKLGDTLSPDLFNQSLTFDTQLGRVLDLEEQAAAQPSLTINPSSSFNSDDLGFVSDLSPPKPKIVNSVLHENNTAVVGTEMPIILENDFKYPRPNESLSKNEIDKQNVNSTNSPDLLLDESISESQHYSKKRKFNEANENSTFCANPSKGKDSDDEIMPTPKFENRRLGNVMKMSRLRNDSVRRLNQSALNTSLGQKCQASLKQDSKSNLSSYPKIKVCEIELEKESFKNKNSNWNSINIIDPCDSDENFRTFIEDLQRENTISLALGCRSKANERKNIIGVRIRKKRKIEKTNESWSQFSFSEVILDGIALYWKGNDVFYLSLDDEKNLNLLRNLKSKVCRMFDVKEQIKLLQRCCSLTLNCSYQDPKIGSWLLSESWKEKNFSDIILECTPTFRNLVSVIGSMVGYSSPGLLVKSPVSAKIRASYEAFLTFHVMNIQLNSLRSKGLINAFEKTEMPVLLSLANMELTGIKINREKLWKTMSEIEKLKEKLENKAYDLIQYRFSLSSSAAVKKALFNLLTIKEDKVTLTKIKKIPSVNKKVLQELANETKHSLPQIILNWRKIRSILSKFVSPLLQISTESARIFGVSQSFTATGRISMHEPNLQNVPRSFTVNCGENDNFLINLRDIFIASENCVLISVDYCQIELRILAHLSMDPVLIKNITNSSDIFVSVASTIFRIFHYQVDDNLRQRAKQTCYGIIYGIGPRTLSQNLEIEESEAAKLMEDFKSKYKGVVKYLEETVDHCRRKGHVTTLLGRRRYLPAINDPRQGIRLEAQRQAINTTIQGSAADLVKTAMVSLENKLQELKVNFPPRLVLHLHDELIFEVGKEAVETVAHILKDTLENAINLIVPTPVKIKTGLSWGNLAIFEQNRKDSDSELKLLKCQWRLSNIQRRMKFSNCEDYFCKKNPKLDLSYPVGYSNFDAILKESESPENPAIKMVKKS